MPPLWLKVTVGVAAALAAVRLASGSARAATPAGPPEIPRAPAPTIRRGSRGPAVAYWRWFLNLPAGDHFDEATDAATREFQRRAGLDADGVVGARTWAFAGIDAGAPTGPPPAAHGPPPPPAPGPQPPSPAPPSPATAADPWGLPNEIPARDRRILEIVASGEVEHEWAPISWSQSGHIVSMEVSRLPVAIRRGDRRVLVSTTYPTAQAIGDLLGGSMLTTKMSDEIWRQSPAKIPPLTRPWSQDGTMSSTRRMIEQSDTLYQKVAQAEAQGGPEVGARPFPNLGKDWVLTTRTHLPPAGSGIEKPEGQRGSRHNSANFGWYAPSRSRSPGGESVIQSVGLAHDMGHTDYSQLLRFVKRGSVTIDGRPVDLAAALADPALSALLQDEGGVLPSDRHPDL